MASSTKAEETKKQKHFEGRSGEGEPADQGHKMEKRARDSTRGGGGVGVFRGVHDRGEPLIKKGEVLENTRGWRKPD